MGSITIWNWALAIVTLDLPVYLAVVLLAVIPVWRILRRVGYSGAWSLLTLIPVVNIVFLYVFAFTRWPAND
jgi:hypothetical protein